MKKYLNLAILLLTLNTPVIASPINLEGNYVCRAIEVGTHQLYTGSTILKKSGDTYTINSKFNDGSTYKGTGIYDPKSHVLAIAAINPKNPDETGVSLNKIQKDGSISVKWTYLNRVDISTAHCLKNLNKV